MRATTKVVSRRRSTARRSGPPPPTLVAVLVALAAAWVWLGARPAAAAVHGHADLSCGDCHLGGEVVSTADAPPLDARLKDRQERLCGTCHRGAVEVSHPSGFVPMRPLPAGFPAGRNGEMTCTTCHRLHAETPSLLRVEKAGRDYCLSCHDPGFFAGMADGGRSLHDSAHLNARPRGLSRIDAYSLECMVCHAENASIAGDGERIGASWRSAGGSPNHPIASDYESVAMDGGYWNAAMLPRELVLPDGKVSCVSCHEGYGRDHGRLLRPRTLCLDCHVK